MPLIDFYIQEPEDKWDNKKRVFSRLEGDGSIEKSSLTDVTFEDLPNETSKITMSFDTQFGNSSVDAMSDAIKEAVENTAFENISIKPSSYNEREFSVEFEEAKPGDVSKLTGLIAQAACLSPQAVIAMLNAEGQMHENLDVAEVSVSEFNNTEYLEYYGFDGAPIMSMREDGMSAVDANGQTVKERMTIIEANPYEISRLKNDLDAAGLKYKSYNENIVVSAPMGMAAKALDGKGYLPDQSMEDIKAKSPATAAPAIQAAPAKPAVSAAKPAV